MANKSKKSKFVWIGLAGLIIIIIGIIILTNSKKVPGKYDDFAKCLKTQGVLFYGAFWCPHCQNQKALFGSSVQYLPYVECSTPDGQSQNSLCQQNNIAGYPTWVFKDGSRLSGETPLADLASKSGCALPQ